MSLKNLPPVFTAIACLLFIVRAGSKPSIRLEAAVPGCMAHGFDENHALDCRGYCPSAACQEQEAADETGAYYFCGCSQVEPNCCHLISRVAEDGSRYEAVGGDCPSCPSPGACTLHGTGAGAQAVCK